MEASYLDRHPGVRDGLNFVAFVVLVLIGTLFINTFVFRSFNVVGPSMEPTMYTGDRLIVNRLPVTWSQINARQYAPSRGEIVVFRNPNHVNGGQDQFIVKRVIAYADERVVVRGGEITVYNDQNPNGFNPDELEQPGQPGPSSPTSGDVDIEVPEGTIFVVGDHREANFSSDSRSGLGTIPLYDIVGPVSLRIWPLDKFNIY